MIEKETEKVFSLGKRKYLNRILRAEHSVADKEKGQF
jgi:hypothetical protein